MSYEKTIWAGEGTLAREQEYDYHWCYERGIITKAWVDVFEKTGDARFFDAAKANVDKYVTEDGEILTFLDHCNSLVDASVKRYIERGFTNLMVCFGCTGGQHRSV